MATARTAPERFQPLWNRNLNPGSEDDSAAVHRMLLQHYGEPHRHYHTLEHVEHCLLQFDDCSGLLDCADAVELAIWFHDIILVPGARDNEAKSADLYLELTAGRQPEPMRHLVYRLIMATLHDGSSLDDADAGYMVDIDLSSFGLDWKGFLRDSANIRAENPHIDDADYQLAQTGFQRSLLARPRFYLSDFFYQRFEQQARDNLARYFEHLESSG